MHDELTKNDIEIMQKELEHRTLELRPKLIEEVKRTRAFGDLSENFEYKEAKREKNRNESRIRYLEAMIKSAKVISDNSTSNTVGLYDKVALYIPEDDRVENIQVVTTVRCNPLEGLISKESPLGKAVIGRSIGDEITVAVSDSYSYTAVIRSIEKSEDDGSAPLLQF